MGSTHFETQTFNRVSLETSLPVLSYTLKTHDEHLGRPIVNGRNTDVVVCSDNEKREYSTYDGRS